MADVFISYAREDAGWVKKLAAELEAAGYSVWWDQNLATGARYLQETEAQLRVAKATVVVWSKDSFGSHWVADEASVARDLGRLAPISKDGTMPPLGFGQYQATDFSRWHGGDDEAMQKLLQALAALSERPLPAPAKAKAKSRGPGALVVAGILALLVAIGGLTIWQSGLLGGRVAAADASVAVTPFKDLSAAKDQAHLANGMTVKLLSRLRTVDKLSVAGGDWMAEQIKETGGDPQTLGQKLAVNYILEGDIRTEGDNVRVNARLVHASDRQIVWSPPTPYERSKNSIFAIQDEIATSVANALSVTLDVGLQSTAYGGTKNFDAYDHYLRGLLNLNVGDPMVMVNELTQAVTIDPNYARAWAELTNGWGTVARLAKTPEEQAPAMKRMAEASSTAERLAPNMWFGHTPRSWYFVGGNDWINADLAIRKAMDLGDVPDPEFYRTASQFLNQIGRISQSARMVSKLVAIDPHYRIRDILTLHTLVPLRRYDEFWAIYDKTAKKAPEFVSLGDYLVLWAAWDRRDMKRVREQLAVLKDSDPLYGEIARIMDRPDRALAKLRSIAEGPQISRPQFAIAAVFAGQYGDHELAVKLLRRAFLGPGWAGLYPTWLPALAEARKTESFKQFVRDIGWEKMYRQSGDWGDFCKPLGDTDFTCQ